VWGERWSRSGVSDVHLSRQRPSQCVRGGRDAGGGGSLSRNLACPPQSSRKSMYSAVNTPTYTYTYNTLQAINRPRTRSAAARQVSNTHERDLVTNQNVEKGTKLNDLIRDKISFVGVAHLTRGGRSCWCALYRFIPHHTASHCIILHHIASHSSIQCCIHIYIHTQHTALHCITLHHTA